MARTVRADVADRRSFYNKESKAARKETRRRDRRRVALALAKGVEALPRFRGTEGWVTH